MSALIRKTANCGTLGDWFKSQGRFYSYTTTPKPGDIVFFDWSEQHTSRDHVGIVESTPDGGATVITIEGNTAVGNDSNGGQVMRRTRLREQIVGYGRPAYTSVAQRDAILARAKAQIGVKESPANSNKVIYNTWYYNKVVSGSSYPWCAVWVCWVFLADQTLVDDDDFADEIAEFQKWLNNNYKTNLVVDGKYGVKTRSGAIKAWQTEMNLQYEAELKETLGELLEVDGVFGELSTAAAKLCEVKIGSTGNLTRIIQGLLYCEEIEANGFDGKFRSGMLTAVKAFQSANGLSADGSVGVLTWTELFGS